MEKSTKYFIIIFSLVITMLIAIKTLGYYQNKQFNNDQNSYNSVVTKIGTDPTNSLIELQKLEEKYPKSYMIKINIGIIYRITNDYETSVKYFDEAIKLNPILSIEPQFCTMFGQILIMNGEKEKAKSYLESAKANNQDPTLLAQIESLLIETN
ncbi:MAG: hypothetical protein K0S51_1299 [Bacillales bacterium]|nr:hypothetical protein [Bacillales bacterium]